MVAETRLTAARFPVWTLAISASALLVFVFPELQSFLIYDHDAISHGELWRLATGNLVHLSCTHLTYDLTAFVIAGTIIETRGYRFFPTLILTSAALIGIILLCAQPALYFFGGLSGVVTAAVTYLCLHGLLEKGAWRWACTLMLAGIAAKIGAELMHGKSFLLAAAGTEEFVPVPLSHFIGAVTAIILFLVLNSARIVHREHAPRISDE